MKKFLRRSVYALTCFSILLLFGARFIKHAFGKVTMEQIFFHLSVKPEFFPKEEIILSFKYFGQALGFIALYTFLWSLLQNVHKTKFFVITLTKKIKSLFLSLSLSTFRRGLLVISCLFILGTLNYVNRNYNVIDYIKAERSTFIEHNYHTNDFSKINFQRKNNLILIFLESMEEQFCNESAFGQNLIPELITLQQKGTSFSNSIQTIGTQYTFAGLVASLSGIPHFSPINIYKDRNYASVLPGSQNILTLLHKNGYEVYAMLGTSKRFTNKNIYLSTNLQTTFYDMEYFVSQGFSLNDPEISAPKFSGFNDDFLYRQAKQKLLQMPTNKPFVFLLETIETHFPHGFIKEKNRKFGDIRDAYIHASQLCNDFIAFLEKQDFYRNTTVVILGDHQWPDINEAFTHMNKTAGARNVYNLFINSCIEAPARVFVAGGYAPFDMAPTILESVGAILPGRRWGLGVSLYSGEETLMSRYGLEKINSEFSKKSSFYNSLF